MNDRMERTEQINLMTQIKTLSVELDLYQDSNQNKNAIEGYEHINSDFESLMDQLQNVSDKYQFFIPVKEYLASSLFEVGDVEYLSGFMNEFEQKIDREYSNG